MTNENPKNRKPLPDQKWPSPDSVKRADKSRKPDDVSEDARGGSAAEVDEKGVGRGAGNTPNRRTNLNNENAVGNVVGGNIEGETDEDVDSSEEADPRTKTQSDVDEVDLGGDDEERAQRDARRQQGKQRNDARPGQSAA